MKTAGLNMELATLFRNLIVRTRAVLFLFFLGSFVLGCEGQEPSDRDTALRSLEISASHLVKVLEHGDSRSLYALMSRRGVVFGLDPPPISLADLQRQFKQRKGAYCLLLDSACLRQEDASSRKRAGVPQRREPLYSYRDLLRSFPKRKIDVFLEASDGGWAGRIRISFDPSASHGETIDLEPLEFLLIREGGDWKITAVVYS